MFAKNTKPTLSKGILQMKFMQRTKVRVEEEQKALEGQTMYANEISNKMLESKSNFITDESYVHCIGLREGRFSFRGMNPEIERLLEIEQAEKQALQEQPKEVSDKEMAKIYHSNQAHHLAKSIQRKFMTKNQKRKSNDKSFHGNKKKGKFIKPKDDDN